MSDNNLTIVQDDSGAIVSDSAEIESVDLQIAKALQEQGLTISDSVKELASILDDAKDQDSALALQVRLDAVKHVQRLHGSSVNDNSINNIILVHPDANSKLKY